MLFFSAQNNSQVLLGGVGDDVHEHKNFQLKSLIHVYTTISDPLDLVSLFFY
jgi:hypothetical protein